MDSTPRTQDPYVATLQTVTQLLRELQLDTRQKHALLNELFENNGNSNRNSANLGACEPIVPPVHEPIAPIVHEAHDDDRNIQHLNVNVKPRDSYLRRLRLIPVFDGESYKTLRNFLDIAYALNESWTNEAEKNELIDTLNLQIRGEARDVVGDLYEITFEEMRDRLLKHFAYLINKEVVTTQLENLRQNEKESITEYSERARKLLKDKCSTYKFLSDEQKREYDRTARRAFARGIREFTIKDRLITRGASSLEDAISYAIEAEFDNSILIPNSELYCKFCKNSGHRERDCRKKQGNVTSINQLMNLLRAAPDNKQTPQNFSNFRGQGNRSNRNWNNSQNNNSGNNRNDQRGNGRKNWNNNNNNNNSQNRNSNQNQNGNSQRSNNNQNQRSQNTRQVNSAQQQNAVPDSQLNVNQTPPQNAEN